MNRRVKEYCGICGASWWQDWEEEPCCPKCAEGEYSDDDEEEEDE
jgi:hypothetical protein